MDLYTFSLVLGATGLGVMGFAGLVRHGADGAHATGPHGGAVHGAGVHGSGIHAGDVQGTGAHAGGLHASGAHAGGAHVHDVHPGHAPSLAAPGALHSSHAGHGLQLPNVLAWLVSPRVIFGILLGLGTAGVVLQRLLGGVALLAAALAIGIAFERLLLNTLWHFTLRFASRPALTLEAAVAGEATAVTSFDETGHGIVQIEVDGQVVQVLGTLTQAERALGHRVRAGETLRVEEVDAERNRCRVSLL